jgi:hypothetical protein
MICANCVARLRAPLSAKRSSSAIWAVMSLAGLLLAWLIFYYLGMGLARIPSAFHGGFQ